MPRCVVENRKWSVEFKGGMVCIVRDFDGTTMAQFTPANRSDAEVTASEHNAMIDMEIQEYDELLDEYNDLDIAFDEYRSNFG